MSVDTNLHRTFDYQLSPASLRIIDWVPVKAVAASILQSGPNGKTYSVVNRTSPKEAVIAAAYVRQESAKWEASRGKLSNSIYNSNGGGGVPSLPLASTSAGVDKKTPYGEHSPSEASLYNASSAAPHASTGPLSSLTAGQSDTSVFAAASPYYTPCAAVGAPREVMEERTFEGPRLQQQQQRPYASNSSGDRNGVANASLNGGLLPARDASPTPAAASTPKAGAAATPMIVDGAVPPLGTGTAATAGGVALTANSSGMSAAQTSSHSGTATPKTGAVAVSATSLARAPPSSNSVLARYSHQWGAAGTMYGFDNVYHNGSFGVLLGLFMGVGYQQTNVFYRQQEQVVEGGEGKSIFPAISIAAPAAGTTGIATGGSNRNSAPAPANNRCPSECSVASPDTVGAAEGPVGLGDSDSPNGSGVVASPVSRVASLLRAPRTRRGPVVAYKNSGGFQLTHAIQCFWYWGARRWTGIFNLRFTPLLSGDATLPLCEYVMRTEITENSILIDDPVVYIHSFVVMLGRRKRTPDDVPSLAEDSAEAGTDPVGAAMSQDDAAANPLVTATTERMNSDAPIDHQKLQRKSAASDNNASTKHKEADAGRNGSRSSGQPQASGADAKTTSTENKKVTSLSQQQPHHGMTTRSTATPTQSDGSREKQFPSSSVRGNTKAQVSDACPSSTDSAVSGSNSTEGGMKMPSWYYWYQRCMMDTSDEWLWNRAASEVAADAAQSTTPWWKLRHVKTGVGLSYRYRKPRGINMYWGWSAQLGRGTSLSGHVDVLRRMSCSISSSFGYLDLSVRIRVNLVTLHQTALDAGLCWRPFLHIPEVAVRVATSANGTTLGLDLSDVAPRLYAPIVERLAAYRAQKRNTERRIASATVVSESEVQTSASTSASARSNRGKDSSSGAELSTSPPKAASPETHSGGDGNREDLVGLLPVTWHYLRDLGSTVTHAYSRVAGVIASTWSSKARSHAMSTEAAAAAEMHRTAAPLPVPPPFVPVPPAPSLTAESSLASMVRPFGRAGVRCVYDACRRVADLGWLETMLRKSHVNVSIGITAEPDKLARDWNFFLILSDK